MFDYQQQALDSITQFAEICLPTDERPGLARKDARQQRRSRGYRNDSSRKGTRRAAIAAALAEDGWTLTDALNGTLD